MKRRKKMIGVSVGAVVLAVAASVAATQPARAVNPDGSFQLVAATGKCVEVIPDANGNFYLPATGSSSAPATAHPSSSGSCNSSPATSRACGLPALPHREPDDAAVPG